MQLLAASRTTSYSTSFHPLRLFSTSSCGLDASASTQCASNLALSSIRAEPSPPSANAHRTCRSAQRAGGHASSGAGRAR
eukprot:7328258-Prymnesium_polylepis.2